MCQTRGGSPSRRRSRSRSESRRESRSSSRSRRWSRSRSSSRTRSHSKNISLRSNERFKRETNYKRRSRSRSGSPRRRSRSRSRFRRHSRDESFSRSRSNDSIPCEADVDRKPLPSSSCPTALRQSFNERTTKRSRHRNYSDERDTDDSYDRNTSDRDSYNQPSTSNCKYNRSTRPSASTKKQSNMRFSLSTQNVRKSESNSDSEPDYGWEDPAPQKLENEKTLFEGLGATVKEKFEKFASHNKNSLDLNAVMTSSDELIAAIKESVAIAAMKKLSDLDEQIEKRQNDYCLRLFNTTDFNGWDDDPALSNVEATKMLKPFKSSVPHNLPLFDKMNMKHVINVMKLTPTRNGNELVFHGHIKAIENEFQGKEMPKHLVNSLKVKKGIIADLVKKYLLPHYDAGRIEPKELFPDIARMNSHIFYERFADENIIKRYVNELFRKVGRVTENTNVVL